MKIVEPVTTTTSTAFPTTTTTTGPAPTATTSSGPAAMPPPAVPTTGPGATPSTVEGQMPEIEAPSFHPASARNRTYAGLTAVAAEAALLRAATSSMP